MSSGTEQPASSPDTIPVVDVGPVGLHVEAPDRAAMEGVAADLMTAFTSWGFVHIRGHGIPESDVEEVMRVSREFFRLGLDAKQRVALPDGGHQGYVAEGRETFEKSRPPDLREAFNATLDEEGLFPDDVAPKFRPTLQAFFATCQRFSERLLRLIAVGLKLDDVEFFVKSHALMGRSGNASTLRTLYYPPVGDNVKPRQIRCGAHSDYGTCTLLFQDAEARGLEVVSCRTGAWVEARPQSGAVLVNMADLLQRWTSDVLVSTRHRVLIPAEDVDQRRPRQSLAFFIFPDEACVVECIDGSGKYPPVTGKAYLEQRFADTL